MTQNLEIGVYILTIGHQLLELFSEFMEPLGCGDLMEETFHRGGL